MRHDVALDGPAFRLRPVVAEDAATIVELRRDPALSRYIHETSPSVEAQQDWLEAYFGRPGDWYWAVERLSDGSTEGFLGVYDVRDGHGEWGRWVLRPGSLAAAESVWLMYQAAFTVLDLQSLVLRVLSRNRPVIAFHTRYGVVMDRVLPSHARIAGEDHDAVEGRMTRELWAGAGPRLHGMAERAAVLLRRSAGA
ncbi:GNAT family N-acetyltransferase [Blastococcus sp. SYSU D00813]